MGTARSSITSSAFTSKPSRARWGFGLMVAALSVACSHARELDDGRVVPIVEDQVSFVVECIVRHTALVHGADVAVRGEPALVDAVAEELERGGWSVSGWGLVDGDAVIGVEVIGVFIENPVSVRVDWVYYGKEIARQQTYFVLHPDTGQFESVLTTKGGTRSHD